MTTYIAGPMSGYPELNFPAFAAVAAELRAQGVDVVSPHEIGHSDHPWSWYVREDRASLEHSVAQACGMRITEYTPAAQ